MVRARPRPRRPFPRGDLADVYLLKSRSPEAQTIGTGTAYVFTGGVLITGTWTRDDRTETFTLADENGSVIALTPGRTWVELPRVGNTVPIS